MKKIFLLTVMVLSFFGILSTNLNAAVSPENQPVLGVDNPDTDFYSHWQPDFFGVNRLEDNSLVIGMTSGYGLRAGFRTAYDITDFEMSLDLTYIDPNVVVTTFFGPQGSYIDGNGATLSIEILKHTSEAHKYLVSIQAGSGAHHVSFAEIVDPSQGDWEDNAWVGYHVVAEDDVVTVSLKDEGDNSTITINGTSFTIASSKLYQNVVDKTSQFFLIGSMNLDGSLQTVKANYVYDAARRDYYSEGGTYTTFLSNLVALETALDADLSVVENVEAASDIKDLMDETLLYSWDQSYLDDRYNSAYEELVTAIVTLGGDVVINSFEAEVETLEAAVLAVVGYQTAVTAINMETPILNIYNNIDSSGFSVDQITRLEALKDRYDTAIVNLYANVEGLVQSQVSAYENSVTDLSTIALVKEALVKKSEVNTSLISLLGEEVAATLNATIDASDNTLKATGVINEEWIVNDNTYIVNNDGALEVIFLENALNGENGVFYSEEKLDVRNFTMTIDPQSFATEVGGWLSFGIMEKTEVFSTADDVSVQDNKGLFFLIVPNEDGVTARVEVYLMSLYCNRFFDAQKQETLTIDITTDIEIELSTEYRDISGLQEEYMSISIGGEKIVADLISVNSMRTALEDYTGYLYVAAEGSSINNNITIGIDEINGKSPFEAGLYSEFYEIPTSSSNGENYVLESQDSLTFNFDSNDEEIVSVKINDTLLETSEYSLDGDQLTINSTILETLSEGSYHIVITTKGGSVDVNLVVSADTTQTTTETTTETTTDEITNESSCSSCGSVSGSLILLSIVTLIGFFFYRRKF